MVERLRFYLAALEGAEDPHGMYLSHLEERVRRLEQEVEACRVSAGR
jgi:hypothetical protein